MHTSLSKLEKFLAWFAIFNGALSVSMPIIYPAITSHTLPMTALIVFLFAGVTSAISGYFGLKEKPWAFWLLFLTFIIQIAEYYSVNIHLSLIGPISFKFGFGWKDPQSQFNLNLLAIFICALSFRTAHKLQTINSANQEEIANA